MKNWRAVSKNRRAWIILLVVVIVGATVLVLSHYFALFGRAAEAQARNVLPRPTNPLTFTHVATIYLPTVSNDWTNNYLQSNSQ